jgi:Fe-S cluster assembly protein SufD
MADWLQIAKNQAEERFRSLAEPTAKDENFRFTRLELPLEGASCQSFAPPAEFSVRDEDELGLLSLQGEETQAFGQVPGALFTDLKRAAILGSDVMRSRWRNLFEQDRFAQRTAARWQNGVFFHVPAGVRLGKAVRVAFTASGAEAQYRNLVILEDGAEATLVVECFSDDAARFLGELTEIRLGAGAKLHLVVLQRLGMSTTAVVRQSVNLGVGAQLKVTPLHLGGGSLQVRLDTHLGEKAELDLSGAARGNGAQHFDFWLDANHEGSRSLSEMNFCFVMGDSSRAVFNGLIQIRKEALDCSASQKSKSLLLGAKATVHAIPKLIIQTDAVKCSHGASVANVNPEQIHYLQSRGIKKVEAERMVVRGFTEPVLDRLPYESLRGRAEAALYSKEGWLQ